jgi:hypothetical protein
LGREVSYPDNGPEVSDLNQFSIGSNTIWSAERRLAASAPVRNGSALNALVDVQSLNIDVRAFSELQLLVVLSLASRYFIAPASVMSFG